MAALTDTNVLVYSIDTRVPEKQRRAREILSRGSRDGSIVIPHQAVVEFVWATTRRRGGGLRLLEMDQAIRFVDDLVSQFDILYPTPQVLAEAPNGVLRHRLSWFDAHLWAYAEANGIPEILSEDFQHGEIYGSVRVVNPFL